MGIAYEPFRSKLELQTSPFHTCSSSLLRSQRQFSPSLVVYQEANPRLWVPAERAKQLYVSSNFLGYILRDKIHPSMPFIPRSRQAVQSAQNLVACYEQYLLIRNFPGIFFSQPCRQLLKATGQMLLGGPTSALQLAVYITFICHPCQSMKYSPCIPYIRQIFSS